MIFSVTAQQFYKLSFGLVDNNKKKEIIIGLFSHLFASANGPDLPLVITNNKNVRCIKCGTAVKILYRPFSIRPGPVASNNNHQKLHDRHGWACHPMCSLQLDLARLQSSEIK